jgi:hypothetical protein
MPDRFTLGFGERRNRETTRATVRRAGGAALGGAGRGGGGRAGHRPGRRPDRRAVRQHHDPGHGRPQRSGGARQPRPAGAGRHAGALSPWPTSLAGRLPERTRVRTHGRCPLPAPVRPAPAARIGPGLPQLSWSSCLPSASVEPGGQRRGCFPRVVDGNEGRNGSVLRRQGWCGPSAGSFRRSVPRASGTSSGPNATPSSHQGKRSRRRRPMTIPATMPVASQAARRTVITSVRDMMKLPPSFDGAKGHRRAVVPAWAGAMGQSGVRGSTARVSLN